MFYLSLTNDNAKTASRALRAWTDAWTAWGALAAHTAQAGSHLTQQFSYKPGASFTAPASFLDADWVAETTALTVKAQRASLEAASHVLTSSDMLGGAELAANPFGLSGYFTSASPDAVAKTAAPAKAKKKSKKKAAAPGKAKTVKAARAKQAKAKSNGALSRPVGERDDLTRIKGVGPKLMGALNDVGIFHFWQIASLSKDEITRIDEKLNARGASLRDGWVKQAKALVELA